MNTKTIIRVSVVDQKMRIVDAPLLASGGENEAAVAFDFFEKWDGYNKTAVFYRSEDELLEAPLDENDTCIVPSEVYRDSGRFSFTVVGQKDGTTRTAITLRYRVQKGLPSGESGGSGSHTTTGCVKSVNGIYPDASGNVEITIPGSSQNANITATDDGAGNVTLTIGQGGNA